MWIQKAEAWGFTEIKTLMALLPIAELSLADTWRWILGPRVQQCLSPAQALGQKQQQSQEVCSSACLTHSEWWRHWVLCWISLGSSGPQSQPVAWTQKHSREWMERIFLCQESGPSQPCLSTRFPVPQMDPYLRNSSALSAAEISVTSPLGT